MEEMITYETLYETLRKEKYKKELQHIDKNFFKQVANYIQEKQEILKAQQERESIFSAQIQNTRKQIENAQKILKELYERRETKIIQLALFSSRTSRDTLETAEMLEEEVEFYRKIIKNLNYYRESILYDIIRGNYIKNKPKEIKTQEMSKNELKTVRITKEMPKFVGEDMTTYGPFKEEDIANLPSEIAELLIKNQRAELL